jgi:hypothetical protein
VFLWWIYVASNNKTHLGLHAKCPRILPDFKQIWKFLDKFLWTLQYQITRKSVQSEPHRCVRTDMTKLISPFCDCANTSDKCRGLFFWLLQYHYSLKREICVGPCEQCNESLTSIKWGIIDQLNDKLLKKKKVKVPCCHCFPISERVVIALWKVPRIRRPLTPETKAS